MPVVTDFNLHIDLQEAGNLRAIRGQNGVRPRLKAVLPAILEELNSDSLVHARGSYELVDVSTVRPGRMELTDGSVFTAPIVTHRLARASRLAIGSITLGAEIGQAISHYFSTGASLKAILMEEMANLLLFKATDHFQEIIDQTASDQGLQASGQLSPGNAGFDFSHQPRVLQLAGAARIGIGLSATGVMDPVHSTSVLIGLGRRMQRWTPAENCESCQSRNRCVHRHEAAAAECS